MTEDHVTAHDEALSIIERGNLDYHAGCALTAILDGDLDKAAFHIERKRALSSGGAPVAVLRALPAPAPARARQPEPIPQIEVTRGVAPLRKGEKRACAKCGQPKGVTAFARGSTVCRLCDGGVVKTSNYGGSKTATLAKTCATCGAEKNVRAFWGGGDVCRSCQGGKAKTGGVKPKAKLKPLGRTPKRGASVEPKSARDTDVPNERFRKCAKCDKVFQLTGFPDRTKNVCKHCTPKREGLRDGA